MMMTKVVRSFWKALTLTTSCPPPWTTKQAPGPGLTAAPSSLLASLSKYCQAVQAFTIKASTFSALIIIQSSNFCENKIWHALLLQKLRYFDMLCCMMQCRFSGVFIGSARPPERASREGGGWRTVQDWQAVRTDVWTRLQDLSLHGNNRPSH